MGARDLGALAADLGGMQTVDDAAASAKVIGDAALRRCRDALDRRGSVSAQAWRDLPVMLREVLLSLCTDRKRVADDVYQPWQSFTPAERVTMGATARTWARQLQGAAQWLR